MTRKFSYFIKDFDNLEKSERLKKQLLLIVFFFLIPHHTFFALYILHSDKIQSLSEALCGACGVLGVFLLKYQMRIKAPSLLIGIYGFISISIGVWENGGFYTSEISWYIITIFSVTVALDRSTGIWLYILSFAFIIFMGWLQYTQNVDFTKKVFVNGLNYSFLSCCSIFLILGLIIVFVFSSENINTIWRKEKVEKISLLESELERQQLQDKINSMNFTKQLLENTEEERKRIASDLHDSISHELLNLKYTFRDDLSKVNAQIDSVINNIRSISRNLHPAMFDKIGLVPNIEQSVERLQTQNNFLVNTQIDYPRRLNAADELQIYRIVQEALTNIVKYSHAHAAKITILQDAKQFVLEVKDNGMGFDVKKALNSGHAFGLHNIIERSRAIGGEAQILSSAKGTIIKVILPNKV
jgi:signal transduction histidine kinase